jgi:hypothetical protein
MGHPTTHEAGINALLTQSCLALFQLRIVSWSDQPWAIIQLTLSLVWERGVGGQAMELRMDGQA